MIENGILHIHVPLISQVFGLYGKLWTTEVFFPFFYGPSAKAMKTRKEKMRIHNLSYSLSK